MLSSALQKGQVFHRRYRPTEHQFHYSTTQWWLALDELDTLHQCSRLLSTQGFAPLWFRRADYLRGSVGDLATCVRQKLTELTGNTVTGRVFFLGNLRTWGLYFSPINCYFVEDEAGHYSYMLAEVSNTPWNERHYYAIDMADAATETTRVEHPKAFHVSPFNPLEMTYQWRIKPPLNQAEARSLIQLDAVREKKHFRASLAFQRVELNPRAIRSVFLRYPINTVTTVAAIYWQALKLWLKRTPIYDHPAS
ncbi:DUF1365 domain-containing protein [Pseudidiomarina aestuarii]|uniref:DUF1365 domain-containing protein n=1 Tax=Pseudidiomarina aestuarii TaxID=624146 RepID=UPI003A96B445